VVVVVVCVVLCGVRALTLEAGDPPIIGMSVGRPLRHAVAPNDTFVADESVCFVFQCLLSVLLTHKLGRAFQLSPG
jgi:hypothetical protein